MNAQELRQNSPVADRSQTVSGKGNALQAASTLQRKLQSQANSSAQVRQLKRLGTLMSANATALQRKKNDTGLPDNLKSGIENLSGHSMDDVKVHYNSSQPAQLNAHAYAQGTDIHIGPGQEQHLPHEAWHVVQQKQGRVQPTMQLKEKVPVNDDPGLENEADVMGSKAMSFQEPVQGKFETAQLVGAEKELPAQGKFKTAQLVGAEEELPAQGKFKTAQLVGAEEELPAQGKFKTAQLMGAEEELPAQGKFKTAQLMGMDEELTTES
ncbi:MAG: DUF4157 domain-containing protein [Bacteroidia bacterium]